jgi:hypothetical protein
MPQSIKSIVDGSFSIRFTEDWSEKQPVLSSLLAHAINIWSLVEATLGYILIEMLGAKASPAFAMYDSLSAANAKIAALTAAAKISLNDRDLGLFTAMMRIHSSRGKQRHKFAHWIRGYCPEAPDYLVLVDPAKTIKQHAGSADLRYRYGGGPRKSKSSKFDVDILQETSCYSVNDMRKTVAEFNEVLRLFGTFQNLVGGAPAAVKDKIYVLLSTGPLLSAELNRLSPQSQKDQPAPS